MVKNDCVYSKHAVNSFSFVIAYVLMQPNASVSYLQLSQHRYPFLRTTCEHTPAHAPPWAACRHCPFLFLHAEKKPNSLLSSPCYRGSFLAWYGRAVLQHPCDTELGFPPILPTKLLPGFCCVCCELVLDFLRQVLTIQLISTCSSGAFLMLCNPCWLS